MSEELHVYYVTLQNDEPRSRYLLEVKVTDAANRDTAALYAILRGAADAKAEEVQASFPKMRPVELRKVESDGLGYPKRIALPNGGYWPQWINWEAAHAEAPRRL